MKILMTYSENIFLSSWWNETNFDNLASIFEKLLYIFENEGPNRF